MSLTKDEHSVRIGEVVVSVTGRTGPVHATWTLLVDGAEADSAKAAGDFALRGAMPDGSDVRAEVHQGLLGDTEVTVVHAGQAVTTFKGFVA